MQSSTDAEPPASDRSADEVQAVRSVLLLLNELDGVPVEEHVRVFDDVHRRLRDSLMDAADVRATADTPADGIPAPGR
ncbi:MAG: hypothetical protein ACR2KL_11535 [Nocardioidaceae bacterium]